MDERRRIIKELEEKNKAEAEDRNRLLEGLGETLLLRIGEGEPFLVNVDDEPGTVLIEYRKLLKEIAEAEANIKSIEKTIVQLKELEEVIAGKEEEYSRLDREITEIHVELGKSLLMRLDSGDITNPSRQQEEALLYKIDELEKKLEGLEAQEGGFFSWIGKNAQIAVSRGLLLKSKSSLQKVYRCTGEKFLSDQPETLADIDNEADSESDIIAETDVAGSPDGDTAGITRKAFALKRSISSLTDDLLALKNEYKSVGDIYGTGSSPIRLIKGLEKNISLTKSGFPKVYLSFGSLAADCHGEGAISSLLTEEDNPVLEKAKLFVIHIAEREHEIERIHTTIKIDNEKAEIEKFKNAILSQRQKISAAETAIADLEKAISLSEQHIGEWEGFLKEDHGGKDKKTDETGKEPEPAGGKKRHSGKGDGRKSRAGTGGKKDSG